MRTRPKDEKQNDISDEPVVTENLQERLLNSAQLREIVPVSVVTLWRWVKKDLWPPPVKICGRNYWRQSEVLDAIDRMADEGSNNA